VSRTRAPASGRVNSPPRPAAATPGPTGGANGAAGADRVVARRTETAATTDAARLAALSGGALVAAPDGRASVVFPSAGQQTGGSVRATATGAAPSPAAAPAPAAASIDVDDLYDQIAARLRRELLLDRERAGELP
jgi:hypothetical protein